MVQFLIAGPVQEDVAPADRRLFQLVSPRVEPLVLVFLVILARFVVYGLEFPPEIEGDLDPHTAFMGIIDDLIYQCNIRLVIGAKVLVKWPAVKLVTTKMIVDVDRVVFQSHKRVDEHFPEFETKFQVRPCHVGELVVIVIKRELITDRGKILSFSR